MGNRRRIFNIAHITYHISHITNSGQSLVEVMVAVAILGLVLTALVSGTTLAIRNANFAQNQARATKLAQEGMEWIRSQRDQGWTNFSSRAPNTYCLNTLSWTAGTCSSPISGDILKREAILVVSGVDKVQAQVIVSWQSATQTHQSKIISYFTKWQ